MEQNPIDFLMKQAYDDLITLSRLNPQYIHFFVIGRNRIRVDFHTPTPGWFYSHNKNRWVDSASLELEFVNNQKVPRIYFLDPQPFHPNIVQSDRELINPNMITRSNLQTQERISHLVAFIWGLLTYQIVDPRNVQNHQASDWYSRNKSSLPSTKVVLQIPSPTSGFRIKARSSGSNPSISSDSSSTSLPITNTSAFPEEDSDRRIHGFSDGNDIRESEKAPVHQGINYQVPSGVTSPGFKIKSIRKYLPPKKTFPKSLLRNDLDWGSPVLLIPQSVWNNILSHGSSNTHEEQFGILLGSAHEDPEIQGIWLEIIEMIPAIRPKKSLLTYVEVSADEMAEIVRKSEPILDKNPDCCRLGWYHTHPGHKIFMSGTDRANHRNVYRTGWQVALVYDPVNRLFGFFSGLECLLVPANNIFFIPDAQPLSSIQTPRYTDKPDRTRPQPLPPRPPKPPSPGPGPSPSPTPGLKPWWHRVIPQGILLVTFICIGTVFGFFIGRQNANRSQEIENRNIPLATSPILKYDQGEQSLLNTQSRILSQIKRQINRGGLNHLAIERLIGQLQAVIYMDEYSKYGREANKIIGLLREIQKTSETTVIPPVTVSTKISTLTTTPTITQSLTPTNTSLPTPPIFLRR